MTINNEEINYDKLRRDLMDYFGTAGYIVSSVAFMDLIDVENANNEKLLQIAINNNFDLNNYRYNVEKKIYKY